MRIKRQGILACVSISRQISSDSRGKIVTWVNFFLKGLRSNISYESSPLTRSTCNCSSYATMGIRVLRNVIAMVVQSNICIQVFQ